MLLAAAQHGTPVREATPNEVKSAIAGYGAADKEQVQRMVQLVLGMSELPRPDDAADALAIAIWAANTDRVGVDGATAGVAGPGGRRADHARRDRLRAGRPRGARRRTRRRARRQAQRLLARRGPVIASVEGVVGAVAADSLVIEVGGHRLPGLRRAGDPRRGRSRAAASSSTPTTSSARTSRRCTASARRRSSASSTCC